MPYMKCPACGKRSPPENKGEENCQHIKDASTILKFSFWLKKQGKPEIKMDDIMAYLASQKPVDS